MKTSYQRRNVILALIGVINGAINLGNYPITEAQIDDKSTSVNYESNTNFKMCACDLHANSCDAFCCCDNDCSDVSTTQIV